MELADIDCEALALIPKRVDFGSGPVSAGSLSEQTIAGEGLIFPHLFCVSVFICLCSAFSGENVTWKYTPVERINVL